MKSKLLSVLLIGSALSLLPIVAHAAEDPKTPEVKLTAIADPVPDPAASPAPPPGAHSVVLTWTASADAPTPMPAGSGYNVYEQNGACPGTPPSVSPPAGFNLLTVAGPISPLTFTDSGLSPGTRCYVVSFMLTGAESVPSNTVGTSIKPASPGALTVTSSN